MRTMRASRTPAPLAVRIGAPVAVGCLILLLWHLVVASGSVPAAILPGPGRVLSRLTADLTGGSLLARTLVTIQEAVLGCVLAAVVALPIGYLIAHVRSAEAALSPYLAASQAVPAIALAPLLVVWVGYGLVPIVLLCALLVFFPLVLSTVLGVRTIDAEITEAAELDGASGASMILHIEAPMAHAAILTGIRNGFTLSITGAIVGEFVMGGQGLGMTLSSESKAADTTGLFATILVLCVLAVALYGTLSLVERLTDPHRDRGDGRAATPGSEDEPLATPEERPSTTTSTRSPEPDGDHAADKELIA